MQLIMSGIWRAIMVLSVYSIAYTIYRQELPGEVRFGGPSHAERVSLAACSSSNFPATAAVAKAVRSYLALAEREEGEETRYRVSLGLETLLAVASDEEHPNHEEAWRRAHWGDHRHLDSSQVNVCLRLLAPTEEEVTFVLKEHERFNKMDPEYAERLYGFTND